MAGEPHTEEERARLIDWARSEIDMPWGPDVIETVARELGTTYFALRADLESPAVPSSKEPTE